jgi:hypothetical protein
MEQFTQGMRIDHERYGEGIISRATLTGYEVFFARGGKMEFSKHNFTARIMEKPAENSAQASNMPDFDEIEKLFTLILDKYNGIAHKVELGEKWTDGTMILQPGRDGLKAKEIPIDVFFHKIVMLRDRLRVLEQNINSHPVLTDEEKINLQQYITRIYGSLTTFNVLFDDKNDWFVGGKNFKD